MLLELTVRGLSSAGYVSAGAADLAQLDAQLGAEGPFDLILVDVNMPEMFGDDVIEYLRQQKGITAKLVLYSDVSEEELIAKVKASGADGFISKGRGVELMLEQVRALIGPPPAGPSGPAPSAAGAAATDKAAPAGPAPARKKRVLILDDSETTTLLLEAELKSKGFEVFTSDSADKATKIILKKQTRPDLVLLDVRMPNVNGEQFCRFIKSNSLFKGIKVLLCSSEEPEELKRICREAGADGFVTKEAVLAKVISGEL
jgi:DNA-binding response OmpR family regulator